MLRETLQLAPRIREEGENYQLPHLQHGVHAVVVFLQSAFPMFQGRAEPLQYIHDR